MGNSVLERAAAGRRRRSPEAVAEQLVDTRAGALLADGTVDGYHEAADLLEDARLHAAIVAAEMPDHIRKHLRTLDQLVDLEERIRAALPDEASRALFFEYFEAKDLARILALRAGFLMGWAAARRRKDRS